MLNFLLKNSSSFILLGAVCLILGCQDKLPVNEQTQETQVETPTGPQPKVVIEQESYEFGYMEVGQKMKHQFVIRNEGEAPLELKKDRTTCKCTVANFSEAEIAPGESLTVELEWEGKTIDENYSHGAFIKTNDYQNREISLRVTGRVEASLEILPEGNWNIGEMEKEKPTEFSGTVTSRVLAEIEFVEAVSSNPLVSVKLTEMDQQELEKRGLKQGFYVKGEVKQGTPYGTFSEQVDLKFLLRGKTESQLPVRVRGFYPGPFRILGPPGWSAGKMTLNFGRFSASEGKQMKLFMFVRGEQQSTLKIEKVISKNDFLKATLIKDEAFESKDRVRYSLTLEVKPGASPMQFYQQNPTEIQLVTNNPDIGTMKIQVRMISF